jgi:glycosyltransferase involved in cell wall biosynthesis
MSCCAALVVADEADIIETTIRHLLTQVDQILVADNLSTDGTTDILHTIAAEDARLIVTPDPERGHYQGAKMTAMAMRALELGHRWLVCADADEVWYAPDGRRIGDWLDGIGRETQIVKAAIYNHVCTALDTGDPNPVRRIGWRQRSHLEMRWGKVACRLRPDLRIGDGNHDAYTSATGTTGYGLELRHFPYRGPDQFVAKAVRGYAALKATDLDEGIGAHWRAYGRAVEEGGEEAGRAWFLDAFFSRDPAADDSLVYDPAPLSV